MLSLLESEETSNYLELEIEKLVAGQFENDGPWKENCVFSFIKWKLRILAKRSE